MAARKKSAGSARSSARPINKGGRRSELPASRGAGRTGPVKQTSGRSTTGRPSSAKSSRSSGTASSAKTSSRSGAAKVPVKRAGPIKPGRPAGRGTGRESAKDRGDDLGGTQVEGRQAVRELLIAGRRRAYEVWIAGDSDPSEVLDDIRDIARANRVPVVEVSRRKLDATARSEAPQGVLAHAAPVPAVPFETLITRKSAKAPFLVAVDGVTDPGNLGALLRCCDGAGVTGVVLPRHRSVHITPTVAKTAVGAVEHVPLAVVAGLPAALAKMKQEGIWIVGLDDAADSSLFDLGNLATDAVCLVLGSEGSGLSRLVRERCDLIVSIPMKGRLSSLNVSAAAALATYEVARHRR